MTRPTPLFWRALTAFLILPGTVAFLGPWMLRPAASPVHLGGLALLLPGVFLLLWCVRDFYVAGRGSLAPWAPPTRLVVVGLYRLSRNPMYVSVLLILCGWATLFASRTLWYYAAFVAFAFHLRVVINEEPFLARTHGAAWTDYRSRVPRWLGGLVPGAGSKRLDLVDARITRWMAHYGLLLLRISLGIVFLWFGALKFFPGMSPASDLAARTIEVLSFGHVRADVSVPLLAAWECLIGIGLLTGVAMRATLLLLALQMAGTLTPLLLFPAEVFTRVPYAPTLEGQYIIKNVVLISAAIVLGATVRGGGLSSATPAGQSRSSERLPPDNAPDTRA